MVGHVDSGCAGFPTEKVHADCADQACGHLNLACNDMLFLKLNENALTSLGICPEHMCTLSRTSSTIC
jgi:hypothetical protein